MKLMRYGAKGAEKPGLVDADGTRARPVRRAVADITAATLAPESLDRLARARPATLPVVAATRPHRAAVDAAWASSSASA